MKSARTTEVNASFCQFGWQSLQSHTLLLDMWCGPRLSKPSCWYTACSKAATATDFSMPPSQMHITRTVAWPDAQSINAALRHCFIRHGKSTPAMQARMASVCSPECMCCRWSNAIPQHATTMWKDLLGHRCSRNFRISQFCMCGNSLLIPIRVWVRGLSRTRQRSIPRWCIGALSNPSVLTGYTSLVSLKSVRGERCMLYLAGGGLCDAGRLARRHNARVRPQYRGGMSHSYPMEVVGAAPAK